MLCVPRNLAEEMLSVQQEAPQLLLYLADDIVLHMGFNSADRQEKASYVIEVI